MIRMPQGCARARPLSTLGSRRGAGRRVELFNGFAREPLVDHAPAPRTRYPRPPRFAMRATAALVLRLLAPVLMKLVVVVLLIDQVLAGLFVFETVSGESHLHFPNTGIALVALDEVV
jgi:hypothetical protein